MTVTISPGYEGRLLRSYLKNTLSLSTSALARLKTREDGITVNGVRVTVRYVLHAGDLLQLAVDDTPDTATRTVLPAEAPLDVLYEDDLLIILNKPAGMPTHPSHGHLADTLANALAYRYARAGVPFVFRSMGRLDRNTSGVVVVAKTQAVAGFLGGCPNATSPCWKVNCPPTEVCTALRYPSACRRPESPCVPLPPAVTPTEPSASTP